MPFNTSSYFKSLGLEVQALKDRVRYLIGGQHWLTDGELKESVLRQVLRRQLPESARVGRGFVIGGVGNSRQIDVLIYDANKPVLYRDGDLVFLSPDAVLGIIEVKSSLDSTSLSAASSKLANDASLVRSSGNERAFAGLFAFGRLRAPESTLLDTLVNAASTIDKRIDFVCIGTNSFVRFWPHSPDNPDVPRAHWRAYEMGSLAVGYFIHNLVDAICPGSTGLNRDLWFPTVGKEQYLTEERLARWSSDWNRGM